MKTTTVDTESRELTTLLLRCGVIAGPLFVTIFLVTGATRADYDPVRHPVSGLELGGTTGWTQVANFLLAGTLTLLFAIGMHRTVRSTWGPLLIGAVAIGLIGAGIFITDPANGYPPGTPPTSPYTWHGALHDGLSAFTFLGWPVACFVFARHFTKLSHRAWARYSLATGILFAVAFILTLQAFDQTPALAPLAGLLQRLTVTIGWTWLTLLALHHLKTREPRPANG